MTTRRKFLKLLGLGVVGMVIHKFLPLRIPSGMGNVGSPLKRFQFRERGGKLVFYNTGGEQLFTLTSDGEIVVG